MARRLREVSANTAHANLAFDNGVSAPVRSDAHPPIPRSLPPFLCLPLAALPGAAPVLELLFDEAFAQRCGRQVLVDRLFDAVLVLLRHLLDSGHVRDGPLAGLGHPQLAKALVAMHDEPASPWTLETLAARAGMSRSRFAEVFSQVVGETPAAYLAQYRITLAKDALLRGEGLERIAQQVGYGSAAALSRAFSAVCGVSPSKWRDQWQSRAELTR